MNIINDVIFENAPGYCQYGKREFFGYSDDKLPNGTPFITFDATGKTPVEARDKLNSLLEVYIKNANGHVHWHMGNFIWQDLETREWRAQASLVVNDYLDPKFTSKN